MKARYFIITLSSLLVFSALSWAKDGQKGKISVYADNQFVASDYGKNLLLLCLNPKKIPKVGGVAIQELNIYAQPSMTTDHLVSNKGIIRDDQSQNIPLHQFRSYIDKEGKIKNGRREITLNNYNVFNDELESDDVRAMFFFLGMNEVNGDGKNWQEIAKQAEDNGKICIVSLPPLTDVPEFNEKILQYNRKAYSALKDTKCRIADPSQTLDDRVKPEDRPMFEVDEKGHFKVPKLKEDASRTAMKSHSPLTVKTCQALFKGGRGETEVHLADSGTDPHEEDFLWGSESPVEKPADCDSEAIAVFQSPECLGIGSSN